MVAEEAAEGVLAVGIYTVKAMGGVTAFAELWQLFLGLPHLLYVGVGLGRGHESTTVSVDIRAGSCWLTPHYT